MNITLVTDNTAIQCCRFAQNLIDGIHWRRFNTTNAYTTTDIITYSIDGFEIKFIPIRSYDTIVGFVDKYNGTVYEVGKYSRTTSKQFSQICNQIYTDYKRKFIEY